VNVTQLTTNATAYCIKNLNKLLGWRTNMTTTMQQLMIDKRLGDGKTTGKIAALNLIYGNLRNNIILQWPELFDPIFTTPSGSVALTDMPNARVDVLQDQFVLGVYYFTQPQPAYLNITRRTIYTPDVTMQVCGCHMLCAEQLRPLGCEGLLHHVPQTSANTRSGICSPTPCSLLACAEHG
jgi:hypothetical protein